MTLTKVSSANTITIPKRVRDNLKLQPFDWVEFSTDDYSILVNRLVREPIGHARRVAEPVIEYDTASCAVQVSRAAEIEIPKHMFDCLMIESGSIVGFFRDSEGYRLIPIHNPKKYGKQTGSVDNGGIQIAENAIMEYSVQITKETRREIAHSWEDTHRPQADDPFTNVNEPDDDADLLGAVTKNDPAFLN